MEEPEFKRVNEKEFWDFIQKNGAHNQKGLPYDHLRVSGKTGFYKGDDPLLLGFVERVLAHSAYYIKPQN